MTRNFHRGRSHDSGNRAGPLCEINFTSVHMVVFIPPTGMKFDIDWYVYLEVWKINYVIPSTHARFNIFHPGRRDGVFIWENSSPLAKMSAASEFFKLINQIQYRDEGLDGYVVKHIKLRIEGRFVSKTSCQDCWHCLMRHWTRDSLWSGNLIFSENNAFVLEAIDQIFEKMFHPISKHLEMR